MSNRPRRRRAHEFRFKAVFDKPVEPGYALKEARAMLNGGEHYTFDESEPGRNAGLFVIRAVGKPR